MYNPPYCLCESGGHCHGPGDRQPREGDNCPDAEKWPDLTHMFIAEHLAFPANRLVSRKPGLFMLL